VGSSAQPERDGWELQRDADEGWAYASRMEDNHLSEIGSQLDLLGLEETRRMAVAGVSKPRERLRKLDQVEATHELLSALPAAEDLSFLHSGLCQTCLPHSRPAKNTAIWRRHSGRFTLIVTPGLIDSSALETRVRQPTEAETDAMYVGVPYGTKARLILIHLQTEGLKNRIVPLGASLSAFMRSLGVNVQGGQRGSIAPFREQCLRIACANFKLQWSEGSRLVVSDTKIVDGLELWGTKGQGGWAGSIELSSKFHEHLREHAVPLDKRAISKLSRNSLGLDLYTLLAYRLPRLSAPLHLRWSQLASQFGADDTTKELGRRIRDTLPQVLDVYPWAKVEVVSSGLNLHPSRPAVPKTVVNGFRLVEVGTGG